MGEEGQQVRMQPCSSGELPFSALLGRIPWELALQRRWLVQLKPFLLTLSIVSREKRSAPSPIYSLIQGSCKVGKPPFLQTKQRQLPQLLFIGLVLQILHQFHLQKLVRGKFNLNMRKNIYTMQVTDH